MRKYDSDKFRDDEDVLIGDLVDNGIDPVRAASFVDELGRMV